MPIRRLTAFEDFYDGDYTEEQYLFSEEEPYKPKHEEVPGFWVAEVNEIWEDGYTTHTYYVVAGRGGKEETMQHLMGLLSDLWKGLGKEGVSEVVSLLGPYTLQRALIEGEQLKGVAPQIL